MTFNLRAGLARWEETTGNSVSADFDPARLGFPQQLVSQMMRRQFSLFQLGQYQSVGADRLLDLAANDSYTVQPNASFAWGSHVLKFGAEGRRYNDNSNPGLAAGFYSFGRNWTQARALQAADPGLRGKLVVFAFLQPVKQLKGVYYRVTPAATPHTGWEQWLTTALPLGSAEYSR